jgi:hypothetical protein
MAGPRAVVERLAAAQNWHDLDGSWPASARTSGASSRCTLRVRSREIDQVRKNWFALLEQSPTSDRTS